MKLSERERRFVEHYMGAAAGNASPHMAKAAALMTGTELMAVADNPQLLDLRVGGLTGQRCGSITTTRAATRPTWSSWGLRIRR